MIRLLPLLLLTATTPALAQSVTIENFIGRIEMVEGDTLSVEGGSNAAIRDGGRSIIIDDDESMKGLGCTSVNGAVFIRRGGWIGGKKIGLDIFPSLTITAPKTTDLIIRDSLIYGTFGDLGSVEASMSSCGDLAFSGVSGRFDVGSSGSVDVGAGNVGEALLRTSGSGNFKLRSAESVSFSSSGSGDLEVRDVGGAVELRTSGSGDAVIASIDGPLSFRSTGSGDLLVGRVNGAVDISSTGSGDVEIDGGNVPSLEARTTGSGDIVIKADVGPAELRTTGSGDIDLPRQSGAVSHSRTGSGDVRVNGERLKRR